MFRVLADAIDDGVNVLLLCLFALLLLVVLLSGAVATIGAIDVGHCCSTADTSVTMVAEVHGPIRIEPWAGARHVRWEPGVVLTRA